MEVENGSSDEIRFLQKSCDAVDQINQKLYLVSKNLERLNENITRYLNLKHDACILMLFSVESMVFVPIGLIFGRIASNRLPRMV